MKKILLIEDRSKRQQQFTEDTHISLARYNDVLFNAIDETYSKLYKQLEYDSFDLEQYSVIISHKSAFEHLNSIIIEKLKTHCQAYKKPLILFSGGIDEKYYSKISYEFVSMNSKIFYSQNLKYFLDAFRDNDSNILILLYGKQWRLNILLNILEKLNYFLEENNEQEFDFEDRKVGKIGLSLLNKVEFLYNLPKNEYDEIKREDLMILKQNLVKFTQESIIYE